jgi:glycosyltransferase involved in cell wall biosynthesis
LLPGPPDTPTGGFVYDRWLLHALRRAGRLASLIVVPGAWPEPSVPTVSAAERSVASLPEGAALLIDGLAFSPLLEVFEAASRRLSLLALVHHPLADETGLANDARDRLFERERRALALVQGVIVTSATTARRLTDFAVPAERIRVVRPGVDVGRLTGVGTCRRPVGAPTLLCVAALTPRKGQDVLLHALGELRRLRWQLRLVGPERDRAFAGRLRRLARVLRLERRVALIGAVTPPRLPSEYRNADLFVLPSHYEGFGIVVAEAAAYGLSIVASDAGAIAEAAAGSRHWLVPPGNPRSLARALRPHLVGRRPRRHRPTRARSWDDVGQDLLTALDELGIQ